MKLLLFVLGVSSFLPKVHAIDNIAVKFPEKKTLRVELPAWKPKTSNYDPSIVDWRSVVSGCKATCRFDRRLCNFYVRASAHDSLSVSEGFGGADGSLLLTEDELRRPENRYDNFAVILSKNALALATRYNTSVADIIAVCGAVAVEYAGGPKIVEHHATEPFLVGRFDKEVPNPVNSLAPANMDTFGFSNFAKARNLTLTEMTALMGSHALLDEKGCEMTNGQMCDPDVSPCTDLRMYRWSNMYYREVCVPNIRIHDPPVRSGLPLKTFSALKKHEKCKFTSTLLRDKALATFDNEVRTLIGITNPDTLMVELDAEFTRVSWFDMAYNQRQWMYTVHDAHMGRACQRKVPQTDYNIEIGNAMNTFRNSGSEWDITYTRAYKKMINLGVNWSGVPYAITGDECRRGYIPAIRGMTLDCSKCNEVAKRDGTYNCPANCKCATAMVNSAQFYM